MEEFFKKVGPPQVLKRKLAAAYYISGGKRAFGAYQLLILALSIV